MSPTHTFIQGRPEFGNPEHIKAIKLAAAKESWKEVPVCPECDGRGEAECFACHHTAECESCDGLKKDRNAADKWKKANPSVNARDMAR